MAWTQSDIDTLDTQYKSGQQRIRFSDGREVQLFSVDDYLKLRGIIQDGVTAAAGGVRCTLMSFTKG